jgi:hypothetical protein
MDKVYIDEIINSVIEDVRIAKLKLRVVKKD